MSFYPVSRSKFHEYHGCLCESVHATVYINPDDLPKFWDAFRPVYDKVIAEPECTLFEVYQSQEEPGTLTWVENWHVFAFQGATSTTYYHDYLAVTTPMYIKLQKFKIFNQVTPYSIVKSTNRGHYR
ncbi:hypothetical protein BO78DRAFT_319995 [Aspergillus sclerotiicarbonarius CBS 121057]|uniref:ABM domain-containing protein n=1 Tax=Aspergillus sclerotiicarbonarius (strain CBS 121057 / IBT 28362) TaxID=1448318 RepID=A0A319E9A5_ASPSB|nr:hypothetical protein BO78DRAFT_319995 [Aspergillus sclerotiicarbonarius CBS 121057]